MAVSLAFLALAACNRQGLVTQPINPCTSGMSSAETADYFAQARYPAAPPAPAVLAPSTQSYSPPTAQALLQAMDADMTVVSASSYSGQPDQAAVLSNLGSGITPSLGSTFAYLSTGIAGANSPQAVDTTPAQYNPLSSNTQTTQVGTDFIGNGCPDPNNPGDPGHDCASLSVTFTAPSNIHSVQFDFNFLSVEYPEFVGSLFNDEFWVSESSPTYNYANIVHDNNNNPININSVFFTQTCTQLPGSGWDISIAGRDPNNSTTAAASSASDCDAGATGLLTTKAPVNPGETVTLTFYIEDHGDGIYDSAVMLDNLKLSTDIVSNPNTGGQVDVTCIYPQTGPVAGGTTVEIHGDGFVNVQSVLFGGTPAASYNVVSSTVIQAVTPPGVAGPVDVKVTASPQGTIIAGTGQSGFTYQ